MRVLVKGLITMGLFGLVGVFAGGQDVKKESLWPQQAPGALGNEEKDRPFMDVYPAGKEANGCAVVVFPGGGYGGLALDHEGIQVARWLNKLGVSAFVLHYRHKGVGYENPAPLSDAQRAIRWVRHQAKELAVDPKRIGILGFSAGGHLASSLGTHFQAPAYEAGDEIDKTTCRPDFMVLVYPVITLEPPFAHMGSRDNLLGKEASEEMVKSFCNHLRVTKETPPTFLIHANDDKGVPPENSIFFYEALRKAEVPAEMHIFLKGGHGFGMRKSVGPAEEWISLCEKWMTQSGWLTNNITPVNKSSGG
jgi:acetyl esterase/lipase